MTIDSIASRPPAAAARGAALRVDSVTKRFGGVTAVSGVSLNVAAGEAIAVIGPNGAGKSSLLKLLSGVYRPDEGSVHLEDVRIDLLSPDQVARHGISLAHQVPRPFKGLTVRENVLIGAMSSRRRHRHQIEPAVEEILATCGLASHAHLAAEHLRLLDLKRLELARALSTDPTLILLDEVAAGLNGRELEDVIELIRSIHHSGRTLVLVEHVEGVVASLVDRVIVIDWGQVIAEGTSAEVAADPKVREVYLGAGHQAPRRTPPAGQPTQAADVVLQVEQVTAAYGDITALREVDLELRAGEIVAVLGANGAGKSTLAGVISGLVPTRRGSVRLGADDITSLPSFERARAGIALCPEGRKVFADLSIRENLELAVPLRLNKALLNERLDGVHAIFPVLLEMAGRSAGALSGGQQQMLAIGRALMAAPRVLVLDELSLGLAPVVIDALYEALESIRQQGISMLLVEQNVHRAFGVADRVYVLNRGQVTYHGSPEPLDNQDTLNSFYFGTDPASQVHHEAVASFGRNTA